MVKLKVHNFGPIKDGYLGGDGYLVIPDVAVFIGDQGTGKSSIAKILSTCSWIEKAMLRDSSIYSQEFNNNEYTRSESDGEKYSLKYRLEYQNIHNYFTEDTYIEYIGAYYKIVYHKGKTTFTTLHGNSGSGYILPQIMYVPAERNFISVIEGASTVKNLPSPLYTFLNEYDAANKALKGDKKRLPVGDFFYQYDSSLKQGVISSLSDNYRIKLTEASSGLQSSTPLFLVTDYLTQLVKGGYETLSKKRLSLENEQAKNEMINLVRDAGTDNREEAAEIQHIENRFENKRLLNIVEEMEQNLYPKSQQNILYELLRGVNSTQGNSLILTTHSPYIINYLSLAIKAYAIKGKIVEEKRSTLIPKLTAIVPEASAISGRSVAVYELGQDGSIRQLESWGDGIPSDRNNLNELLRMNNELFNDLLELEDEL